MEFQEETWESSIQDSEYTHTYTTTTKTIQHGYLTAVIRIIKDLPDASAQWMKNWDFPGVGFVWKKNWRVSCVQITGEGVAGDSKGWVVRGVLRDAAQPVTRAAPPDTKTQHDDCIFVCYQPTRHQTGLSHYMDGLRRPFQKTFSWSFIFKYWEIIFNLLFHIHR